MMPIISTSCWCFRGTAKPPMITMNTNRLSIDSEYSVSHPATNSVAWSAPATAHITAAKASASSDVEPDPEGALLHGRHPRPPVRERDVGAEHEHQDGARADDEREGDDHWRDLSESSGGMLQRRTSLPIRIGCRAAGPAAERNRDDDLREARDTPLRPGQPIGRGGDGALAAAVSGASHVK